MSKPSLQFLSVRAESGKTPEIHIRGSIDRKWDAESYSVTDTENIVLGALSAIPKGTKAKVLVNSEGGSVKMSLGMHNAFKARADDLTFYNCGLMASAATILPPKGSRVVSPTGSVWMVHKPAVQTDDALNADDTLKLNQQLNTYGDMMAEMYAERTGGTAKDWRTKMKAVTYMTGKDAIKCGLADDDGGDDGDETPDAKAEITAEVMATLNPPAHIKKLLAVAGHTHVSDKPGQAASISTRQGGEGKNGGKPAATQKKNMNQLIAAFAAHGITIAAGAEEDVFAIKIAEILASNKTLTEKNSELAKQAEAARKARIEAHVQAKVDAKVITGTPEHVSAMKTKWVDAIMKDDSAQALLDAMPAPQAAAGDKPQRGAAPPPKEGEGAGDSVEAQLESVRAEMKTEKDPDKIAVLALKARELRGHKDLFAQPAAK
jgi:ATP-dependent protease ClpP protease subunit